MLNLIQNWLNIPQKPAAQPTISTIPDQPIAFGLKTEWLAVQAHSPETVLNALPIQSSQPANWASGFAVLDNTDWQNKQQPIFITPNIGGWVLIVSRGSLPAPMFGDTEFDDFMNPLLHKLPNLQYFGSLSDSDYVAWAKAENGQ